MRLGIQQILDVYLDRLLQLLGGLVATLYARLDELVKKLIGQRRTFDAKQ